MKDNKLIAEFMGAVGTPKYNPTEWDVYITGCLDVDSDDENAQHFYTPDDMKYHTSWDWLMPVVEKIEGAGLDPHEMIDSSLRKNNQKRWRSIEDTYNVVVYLIKIHNNDTI